MVTLGRLTELLHIDEGELYWLSSNKLATSIRGDGYKFLSIDNVQYLAHRIMWSLYYQMDYKDVPKVIDHKDGNPSNNTKTNLRGCLSNKSNLYNCKPQKGSSKYKGVRWHKQINKWTAQIMYSRKSIYLGSFEDETEAAKAYDKAAKTYFGEFAYLNIKGDNC